MSTDHQKDFGLWLLNGNVVFTRCYLCIAPHQRCCIKTAYHVKHSVKDD
jgi:hypothetical protein